MKQVSAGIILCDGKILIAQRSHSKDQAYLWEFPGGKQEPEETIQECLRREIKEELNIDIELGDHFMTSVYHYDTGSISLDAWFAFCLNQKIPSHLVHEKIKWISQSELDNYNFAPADIPIKDKLKTLSLPLYPKH